jgi:hypothetical protein
MFTAVLVWRGLVVTVMVWPLLICRGSLILAGLVLVMLRSLVKEGVVLTHLVSAPELYT